MKLKKGQIIKATSNEDKVLHFLILKATKKHMSVYCIENAKSQIVIHNNFVFNGVKSIEVVSDVPIKKKTKKETA